MMLQLQMLSVGVMVIVKEEGRKQKKDSYWERFHVICSWCFKQITM